MTTPIASVLEHDIGPNGLLAIRVPGSDIRVRAVNGSIVRIHDVTGTLERSVRIDRAPGSLSIQADRGVAIGIGPVGIGAWRRVPDLDIETPAGTTIVVETASGTVSIDGLTGDQRYRTASGDVVLRDVSGQLTIDSFSGDVDVTTTGRCAIAARTVSGDLSMRGDHERPSARVATTSGDIRLEGRFEGPGPFSVETVSGDTALVPSGGLRLEVRTVTGDVSSDVKATSVGGRGARTIVIGDDGATMTVRSISGDVRVLGRDVISRATVAEATADLATDLTPPDPPAPPPLPAVPMADVPARPDEPDAALAAMAAEGPTEPFSTDQPMAVLEALERGEIDVEEAARRLAALDPAPAASAPA